MQNEVRKIELPEKVNYIINELFAHGYESYAVGGCVRDSLLGKEPNDWDVTTSALPQQVKEIFKRTVDTGIAHGTVTVMLGKEGYEVTTYRIDGEYEDSRHPKSVEFTSNLVLDLKRRDFTINAMAYNDKSGIVDEFGGTDDLKNGIIRCVGSPDERFTEDALRILRAVRFSAQLGFVIEDATKESIQKLAHTLTHISKERIHTEFGKMLLSKNPDYFVLASKLGITKYVLPKYDALPEASKYESARALKKVALSLPERYAALLMHLSSDEVKRVLKELKLDNDTINMASKLVKFISLTPETEEGRLRHIINKLGSLDAIRVMSFVRDLHCFDAAGLEETSCAGEYCLAAVSGYDKMIKLTQTILDRGDCVDLKGLCVSGTDLMEAGVPKGKELGETLNRLLMAVLDDPSKNNKEILLGMLTD